METIRAIMLNLIAIVFLTTLLDLLLPEGSMRGYVKMTMGFFVVLTLLQPVMQMIHPEGMLQQWQMTVPAVSEDAMAVQGNLYEEQQRKMDQLYQEKLEEQITSLLLLSTELEQFAVECDVAKQCLQQIRIRIAAEEPADYSRIAQALGGYYGLASDQILITTGEVEHHALE